MSHVLIIEDNLLVALDVQACVEELGAASTAVASSEDDAVRMALAKRPDLITSDVRLAQGLGTEAVRRIVAHYGDIPVLYITANPDAVKESGLGGPIVVKPYRWEQLTAEVRALGLVGVPS